MVVCLGIWGEYALEAFLFLVHGKEHARICLQVAFHHCDLHVAAVYGGRKEGDEQFPIEVVLVQQLPEG